MFVLFFIVAFITVNLSAKIRLKESFLYKRERTLSEVFELSKLLNNIISISDLKIISEDFLSKIFKSETELIFDSKNVNDADKAIIEWVKTNKKPAGRFTNTFFKNDYYYYPIVCVNNESGVIKFKFTNEESLSFEKENLIQTFAIMISGIADRIFTIEKSKKNAVENESQKLFSIILKSISHELRTPLTSLSLCVNGLIDEAILHNYESRNMLITDIRESVVRLNRVVGNLLNMARLESGNLSLHLKEYDIVDLINSVLIKHESELKGYTVVTEFSDNMPLIKIDFNLFEQVISNILINAVYYNDCGITIKISVFDEKQNINIIISDDGRGLKNPEKIFNKFYREQPDKTGGLGLGLTICKEIIEMHNGIITAESKTGCGAEFKIIIPFTGGKI